MKTIYKGQVNLIDPKSGENFNFDVITKKLDTLDKKGWRRVIMGDLMASIEQIGNKKIKVLEYLIDNMDKKNQINTNYREISKEIKISYKTISDTFKSLKDCNLIKKYGGVYVLNCSIISTYGNSDKNSYLMIEYGFNSESIIKDKKPTKNNEKDKEIEQLKEKIKQLELLIPDVA